MHAAVWWENLKKRDYLENLGVDGRIILRWILRNWMTGRVVKCSCSALDRWLAVVNSVMNFRVT